MTKKKTTQLKVIFHLPLHPNFKISKRELNGHSTSERPIITTCIFKKWLHFTSKRIKIALSYFVRSMVWPCDGQENQ
jgi:hypothetical protein